MKARLLALVLPALLSVAGCSSPPRTDASGSHAPPKQPAGASIETRLVGKVWRQTAPKDAASGTLYIFLPGGTLLQTSCVEVYRLSTWRVDGERTLTITEEPAAPYQAEVESEDDQRVRMRFKLGAEWQPWKTMEVAKAPFVCPDMRR
jgi:hypothetical protein